MEDLFEMMTQTRKRRLTRSTPSQRESYGTSEFRDPNWLDLDHALAAKRRSMTEEFETDWSGEEETPAEDPRGGHGDM